MSQIVPRPFIERRERAFEIPIRLKFLYVFGFVPNGLSMYVSYPKARAADPQVVAFRDWLLATGRA